MSKKYDLIVVGGGPAGIMAAKTAAEKGLGVALLERKKDPLCISRPCAETLVLNEEMYGECTIFNAKNHQLCFLKNGFSIKYEGPYRDIVAFSLYSLDGDCINMLNSMGRKDQRLLPVQWAFEKGELLKELIKEAQKNDVHLFTNTNVASVDKKGEYVQVISSDGKEYEGAFVIAADGVNSRIAQCLGFNKKRKFYGTLRGLIWHVQGVKLPSQDTHIHIEGGQEVGTTFCICPRASEDEYFIFVGGLNPALDLYSWADHIMSKSRFSAWFKGTKKIRRFSIVINIYSPIEKPIKDNVLLVGDAAYTTQVTNTGAVVSGWKAGNVVSKAFYEDTLNRDGIQDYLHWWEESYCNCDYTIPYPLRGNLGVVLSNEELCYFLGLFKEPIPFSSNPFTAALSISEAMEKVMPLILRDKPGIVNKLTKFNTGNLTELMGDYIKGGFPSI